jgi:mannose-6-phosphate isomerase-like protein (cupin superfamily)
MAPRHRIQVFSSAPSRSGDTLFSEPLPSDETLIAEIAPTHTGELFCHRRQTDQLMVIKGELQLVVVEQGGLRQLTLREGDGTWVRIPPGVPHGAINRGRSPVLVVNAVLRHGDTDPRDYQPRPIPPALRDHWRRLLR